jgi:two-component system chemotaxis response regulator CheY
MDQDQTIKLSPNLDADAAKELLAQLKAGIGTNAFTLDASGVEAMSLPGIQIVLSAIRSQAIAAVQEPSIAFVSAFADHGIDWEAEAAGLMGGATVSDAPAADAVQMPVDAPVAAEAEVNETSSIDSEAPESPSAPSAEGAPKRILTIDDSKTMRDMLMLTLSSGGFEVLQAVDGQDGIEVLSREKNVDVVITDINMPKLDGYGVIKHMRERPEYDSMPILVLTTESDQEKKTRAQELGATGFIVKPFNPNSLVEVIKKVAA